MAWRPYKKDPDIYIRISQKTKNGIVLYIPKSVIKKYNITDEIKYIALAYEDNFNFLGFQFLPNNKNRENNAMTFDNVHRTINIGDFCKKNKLDAKKITGKYEVHTDPRFVWIFADLTQKITD